MGCGSNEVNEGCREISAVKLEKNVKESCFRTKIIIYNYIHYDSV